MKRPLLLLPVVPMFAACTADSPLDLDLQPNFAEVANICTGDITLSTQADVDAFNCDEVTGTLWIEGPDIHFLDGLSELTSVGGDLVVTQSPLDVLIPPFESLSALTSVDGDFRIEGNPHDFDISGLPSLTLVGGSFLIQNNPWLHDVKFPRALTSIGGSLVISENVMLEAVATSSQTASFSVGGGVSVDGSPIMAGVALPVSSIAGDLVVIDAGVVSMPALTSVGGNVELDAGNPYGVIDLSALTSVGGSVRLAWRSQMEDLSGLSSLTSVGGDLSIAYNDDLQNVDGLSSLTSVGGDLWIVYNDNLQNVDDLWAVTSVGESVYITENPQLSACVCGLYSLLDAGGIGGAINIYDNAEGCNSQAELLAQDPQQCSWWNQPPIADPDGPYTADEGDEIMFDGTGSSDPNGDALEYSWDFDDGTVGSGATTIHTYSDQGSYTVTLTVTDPLGETSTASTTAEITNVAPTATFGNEAPVDEGQSFTLTLTDHADPSAADVAAGFQYAFDCGDGSGYGAFGTTWSASCPTEDNATRTVKGKIRDKDAGETEYSANVEVLNIAPTVGPITAPLDPVQVGTPISASADFTDPGTGDTHTAMWDWGDGSSPGTVNESNGSGSVADGHMNTVPGVYTIQLTVTDDDGGSGQSVFQYVVVYDPAGGFVSGGGWINSPAGAYTADPTLTGKANFGFVSKYKKGASTPTGNTEFQFKAGDLNFHSSSYEWLVINKGDGRAQYKGVGTINGMGEYKFTLWAGDGSPDTFRIKIWLEDENTAVETVVYDNGSMQAIGGGSIVIHK